MFLEDKHSLISIVECLSDKGRNKENGKRTRILQEETHLTYVDLNLYTYPPFPKRHPHPHSYAQGLPSLP